MRVWLTAPLFAVALLAGCATSAPGPDRRAPQFAERLPTISAAALMPPDVKVYELSAGGTRELMDDWSQKARENVVTSLHKRLQPGRGAPLGLKEFDPAQDPALEEEFRDVRALYEAVSMSVIAHTYAPGTTFPTKLERFDYSLGPLPRLGEAAGADTLLFVSASDEISSGGRVALNFLIVVMAAAGGTVAIPAGGATVITAALVDTKTGDLLWFTARGSSGAHDLREPASADSLVADTFEELRTSIASGRPASTAPPSR